MNNFDNSGYTGRNVGVCVLDTGIFPHIDFTGRIRAFHDFIGYRIRPYDDNSHGTHVCGIIGGDGRASEGRIRGVAPGCDLIVLKVLDRMGNGRKEDVLRAFRWILENRRYYGIRVVNISVGTTCRTYEDHKVLINGVERLWDEGLIVVAAAGNQGPRSGSVTAPERLLQWDPVIFSEERWLFPGEDLHLSVFVNPIWLHRETMCLPVHREQITDME